MFYSDGSMAADYIETHHKCIMAGWEDVKRRERPKTTYLQVTQTQLKDKHIQTIEDAMIEAQYRDQWRVINQDKLNMAARTI